MSEFKKRNKVRIGEKKAEEYYKGKGIFIERYGLDLLDSGLSKGAFCKIPEIIRNTPDFIAINDGFAFVEAKAFKGAYLNLKLCDMESYYFWSGLGGFVFFIWSVDMNRGTQIRYENMMKLINDNKYSTGKYRDNNKEYYKVPWVDIKGKG